MTRVSELRYKANGAAPAYCSCCGAVGRVGENHALKCLPASACVPVHTAFRMALTRMGLTYAVGIQSSARFWPPGAGPLPPKTWTRPKAWTGQGRPPTLMRRDAQNQPQSAAPKSLPADAWRDVAWREGVAKTLHSRFARLDERLGFSAHQR
jgi:SRSO17 transposase